VSEGREMIRIGDETYAFYAFSAISHSHSHERGEGNAHNMNEIYVWL